MKKKYITEFSNEEIYHYTNQKGIYKILCNEEIRFVHYKYLNESTETEKFDDILDDILLSYKIKDIRFYNVLKTRMEMEDIKDHFICSFSTSDDNKIFWDNYSKKDLTYNISFKTNGFIKSIDKFLKENDLDYLLNIRKVIYKDKNKEKELREQLNYIFEKWKNIENNSNNLKKKAKDFTDFHLLINFVLEGFRVLFKNKHFESEKEVRAIVTISEKESEKLLKFQNHKSFIRPYISVNFNKETLNKIKLGPFTDDLREQGIISYADYLDYNAGITKSDVPL